MYNILCSKLVLTKPTQIISRFFKKVHSNTFKKGPKKTHQKLSKKVAPLKETNPPPTNTELLNPVLFATGFTGISFVGAMIWHHENLKNPTRKIFKFSFWEHENKRPSAFEELKDKCRKLWASMNEGHKLSTFIIAANAIVLLAWRNPKLHPQLLKYFTSGLQAKNLCLPMLFSTFSHISFFHFAANMYVLWSISPIMVDKFGKEQFLALYCSAGVLSSLTSLCNKSFIKAMNPSVGASGSLMAIFGALCTMYPDAKLSILFLPFFVFTASSALTAVLICDTTGILLRWKIFDHAAHLGGSIFGMWYATYGQDMIWRKRHLVVNQYQTLKDTIKRSLG